MAKLNITIEAPVQAFSKYADELGYQDKIPNPDYIPAEYGEGATIVSPAIGDSTVDNPETKQLFLSRSIKTIIANALADKAVRAVERDKQKETKDESDKLRKAIEKAITIS